MMKCRIWPAWIGETWLFHVALNKKMSFFPAGIYVFKVNNENTKAMYEICSELTMSSE